MTPGDQVEVIAPWWHKEKLPRHVAIERISDDYLLPIIVSSGDGRHWALAECEVIPA